MQIEPQYVERTNFPTPSRVAQIERRRQQNSEKLDRQVARSIQKYLLEDRAAMRLRLNNWGRWRRAGNKTKTGWPSEGQLYRMRSFAPFQENSGYHEAPPEPIDQEDAELLHKAFIQLDKNHKRAIKQSFEDQMANEFLADIWKCTERTVINRINAAMDKMTG